MWEIGVDIVEVQRFKALKYSDNKGFYARTFTPREIEYCLSFKSPAPHFAATFAAKEAIYKAVNRHFNIRLHEIEITRERNIPKVLLTPKQSNTKRGDPKATVKVSLSHSSAYAVAFALAEFSEAK